MANYIPIEHMGEMFDEDRTAMTPARRRMIHKHRKYADLYGPKLPYEIGIFKKKLGNKPFTKGIECEKCGHTMPITDITYIIICKCGELIKIDE